jgi:phospholipid-transporting ATPase
VLCEWKTVNTFHLTSQSYGKGVTEVKRAAYSREGKTIEDERPEEYKGRSEKQFWDPNMMDETTINKQENKEEIIEFLRLLAVCHTVIIERNQETNETLLSAASPDELALVNGAKYLGVEFLVNSIIPLTIPGSNIERN